MMQYTLGPVYIPMCVWWHHSSTEPSSDADHCSAGRRAIDGGVTPWRALRRHRGQQEGGMNQESPSRILSRMTFCHRPKLLQPCHWHLELSKTFGLSWLHRRLSTMRALEGLRRTQTGRRTHKNTPTHTHTLTWNVRIVLDLFGIICEMFELF